jgi:hypothetical protein
LLLYKNFIEFPFYITRIKFETRLTHRYFSSFSVAPHFVVAKEDPGSNRFWVVHQDKNEKLNFVKNEDDFNTDYGQGNENNAEIEEFDDYYEEKDIEPETDIKPETDNFGLRFGELLKPIKLIKPLKPLKPIKPILSSLPTLPTLPTLITLPTLPTFPTLPTLTITKRTKIRWTKLRRTKIRRSKAPGLVGAVVRAKLVKTIQQLLSEVQQTIANCV